MSFIDTMKIGENRIIGFLILVFIAAINHISRVVAYANTIVEKGTHKTSRFRGQGELLS